MIGVLLRPVRRYWARYQCHGNPILCCQYTDDSTCNSPRERHLIGRLVNARNLRREP